MKQMNYMVLIHYFLEATNSSLFLVLLLYKKKTFQILPVVEIFSKFHVNNICVKFKCMNYRVNIEIPTHVTKYVLVQNISRIRYFGL